MRRFNAKGRRQNWPLAPDPRPLHTILGGGPAGLSVAYYARKNGLSFTLFEAGFQVGGNCRTFRHGDFLYDSGAHRFHDVIPEITGEIKALLGDDLREVQAPSQIYLGGKLINFPPSPLDLLRKLSFGLLAKAGMDYARARFAGLPVNASFEDVACSRYGRTFARLLLLNYSEKLWGIPCESLSPAVAGRRLKGLDLRTFALEVLRGARAQTEHLEGKFYYPRLGYGMISDRLAEYAGREHLRTESTVTRLVHDRRRILEVEINGSKTFTIGGQIFSTLPVNLLLKSLDPPPPPALLELAGRLKFRHLILVAFFLNQPTVTENASVYFPARDIPFTRVYEPRNRSASMSPPGKTSLVAELPSDPDDERWRASDEKLIADVYAPLHRPGWIHPEIILGTEVRRMAYAYPVLNLELSKTMDQLTDYLKGFENLTLVGRNARFVYAHLHDMMQSGKDCIEEFLGQRKPSEDDVSRQ